MSHRSCMSFIDYNLPLPVSALPVRKNAVIRFDEPKIVFKHGQDFYLAPSRCAHRGASLADAVVCKQRASLVCPYHGKRTSPDQKLFSHLGILWTADPQKYFESAIGFSFCGSRSYTLNAAYHVVLDNFNEGSHTAYVHRLLGPTPEQTSDIRFSWKTNADHLQIKYIGPQRKNLLFYGLNSKQKIDWHISWEAYFESSHMVYHSSWQDRTTGKKVLSENLNYYFINPIDEQRTELTAFVFTKPARWMRFLLPVVKKVSMLLTNNQIEEDIALYKKIGQIPKDFSGQPDKFDEPLGVLRKKMGVIFQKYL